MLRQTTSGVTRAMVKTTALAPLAVVSRCRSPRGPTRRRARRRSSRIHHCRSMWSTRRTASYLYNDRDTLGDAVKDLTKVESESIYAETYAELFNLALHNNEALFETFGDTLLTTATATNGAGAFNLDRDGDGDDPMVWSAAAAAGCMGSLRPWRAC